MGQSPLWHFPEPGPPTRPERRPPSGLPPAGTPLVVDAGSYELRAGWAGQETPCVVFRALLHRLKAKARPRGGDGTGPALKRPPRAVAAGRRGSGGRL